MDNLTHAQSPRGHFWSYYPRTQFPSVLSQIPAQSTCWEDSDLRAADNIDANSTKSETPSARNTIVHVQRVRQRVLVYCRVFAPQVVLYVYRVAVINLPSSQSQRINKCDGSSFGGQPTSCWRSTHNRAIRMATNANVIIMLVRRHPSELLSKLEKNSDSPNNPEKDHRQVL